MKESDVVEVMALCRVYWPQADLSQAALPVWMDELRSLELADVRRVLRRLAAEDRFPPNPVRLRTTVGSESLESFGEVFAELIEAASTCDWFDPNPPASLSLPAYALAQSLGWPNFRASNPANTYFVHQAEQRYGEIVQRARRRVTEGLPAFEPHSLPSGEVLELVEGIGNENE